MADFQHPPLPADCAVPLSTIQTIVEESGAKLIDLSQPQVSGSLDPSIISAHEAAPEITMTRVYSDQVEPYLVAIARLIRPDLAGQLPVVVSHEPTNQPPFYVETMLGYALRYVASANHVLSNMYIDGKSKARKLAHDYQVNRAYILEDMASHFGYPDGSLLEPLICAAVVNQNALNEALLKFAQRYPEGVNFLPTPELAGLTYLKACLIARLAPIIQSSTEPSIQQIIDTYIDFFVPDHPIKDTLLERELERIRWSAFGEDTLGIADKRDGLKTVITSIFE